jgi:hypothetical protein
MEEKRMEKSGRNLFSVVLQNFFAFSLTRSVLIKISPLMGCNGVSFE